MNYYIQGDAAKAEQIKAAFEKLGYEKSNTRDYSNEHWFFFIYKGKVICTDNEVYIDLVKGNPDYKELELPPIEPKFKVGDWVAGIDEEGDMATEKIVSFSHNKVLLVDTDGCRTEYPKTELNGFRPWTIADAKDGDVLMTTKIRNCPFIYRKTDYNNNLAYYYAGVDGNGDFCEGCLKRTLYHFGPVENVVPATKEQRDLLFAKMKEAGYQWDANKKELRKIQPHYDIKNFHVGMPVLVRADNNCRWDYSVFSRITGNESWQFAVCNGVSFTQCIPFEGNEHLLGTTDQCDEQYINW